MTVEVEVREDLEPRRSQSRFGDIGRTMSTAPKNALSDVPLYTRIDENLFVSRQPDKLTGSILQAVLVKPTFHRNNSCPVHHAIIRQVPS